MLVPPSALCLHTHMHVHVHVQPAGNVLMQLNRAMIYHDRMGAGGAPLPAYLAPHLSSMDAASDYGGSLGALPCANLMPPPGGVVPANGSLTAGGGGGGHGTGMMDSMMASNVGGSMDSMGGDTIGDSGMFEGPAAMMGSFGNAGFGGGGGASGGGGSAGGPGAGANAPQGMLAAAAAAVAAAALPGGHGGGGNGGFYGMTRSDDSTGRSLSRVSASLGSVVAPGSAFGAGSMSFGSSLSATAPLHGLGVEATLGEMQQMALIGSGGGGCVYIGRWRGVTVAVKFIVSRCGGREGARAVACGFWGGGGRGGEQGRGLAGWGLAGWGLAAWGLAGWGLAGWERAGLPRCLPLLVSVLIKA